MALKPFLLRFFFSLAVLGFVGCTLSKSQYLEKNKIIVSYTQTVIAGNKPTINLDTICKYFNLCVEFLVRTDIDNKEFRVSDTVYGFQAICSELHKKIVEETPKSPSKVSKILGDNAKKYRSLEDDLILDLMKLKGCVGSEEKYQTVIYSWVATFLEAAKAIKAVEQSGNSPRFDKDNVLKAKLPTAMRFGINMFAGGLDHPDDSWLVAIYAPFDNVPEEQWISKFNTPPGLVKAFKKIFPRKIENVNENDPQVKPK